MTALAPYQPGGEHAIAVLDESDSLDFCRTAFDEIGIQQSNLTKVKTPSGGQLAFEIQTLGGATYERSMDVVIAFARANQRAWYAQDFEDSGGGSRPDCISVDGVHGVGFREVDEAIANAESNIEPRVYNCGTPGQPGCCPWNEWRSARGGGAGKDCSELTFLYFFAGEQRLPQLMIIPPTSIGVFRKYAIDLTKFGRKVQSVVTRISLVAAESESGVPYAKLVFTTVSDLPADRREDMKALGELIRSKFADFNPLNTPTEEQAGEQPTTEA